MNELSRIFDNIGWTKFWCSALGRVYEGQNNQNYNWTPEEMALVGWIWTGSLNLIELSWAIMDG
jgi:hypothetical protein